MEYYSLNAYLRHTFGTKVYKISLDAGCTCPNRDGLIDTRGCIFCSASGSGDFAEHLQMQEILHKCRDKQVLCAYFQAYTNTYAPVSYLKEIFNAAIEADDIVALSIATRPDCLDVEVLSLLEELCTRKPVWVELGLQTIHEDTAKDIRRGYALPVYDEHRFLLHVCPRVRFL